MHEMLQLPCCAICLLEKVEASPAEELGASALDPLDSASPATVFNVLPLTTLAKMMLWLLCISRLVTYQIDYIFFCFGQGGCSKF